MKKTIALFILLIVCGIPNLLIAQSGVNNLSPAINMQPVSSLNFMDNIGFTPGGEFSKLKDKSTADTKKSSPVSIEHLTKVQSKFAMIIDVAVESMKSVTLYNFINEWYGTRYRMGGTTKKGIDCSAFTGSLLFAVYALSVPRTAREQYSFTQHIKKDNLAEGDLVFFNTRGGVSHVGVYLSNGYFVHSSSSQGVMISNLSDKYFSERFISGGRMN